MSKHIQIYQDYLKKRGHMVAFLMLALMVTSWLNVFQDVVGSAVVSAYF